MGITTTSILDKYGRYAPPAILVLLLFLGGVGEVAAAPFTDPFPACATPVPSPDEIGVPVAVPLTC